MSKNRKNRKSGWHSRQRHSRRQRNRTAPAAQPATDQQARSMPPSRGAGEAGGSAAAAATDQQARPVLPSRGAGGADGSAAAANAGAAAALIQRRYRGWVAQVAAAAKAERAAAVERILRWANQARARRAGAAAAVAAAGRIQSCYRGWSQRAQATRAAERARVAFPQPASAERAWAAPKPDAAGRASQEAAPERVELAAQEAEEPVPAVASATGELGAYDDGRCKAEASGTVGDRATSRAPAGREELGLGAAATEATAQAAASVRGGPDSAAAAVPLSAVLYFWSHRRGPYVALSNWYPCGFSWLGRQFRSAEQALMFSKAELFGDSVTAAAILKVARPAELDGGSAHGQEVQRLGRAVEPFDREAWRRASVGLMEEILYAKFSQNGALGDLLLSTEPQLLVEASPWDATWGIGAAADAAAALPRADLERRLDEGNRLGKCLMTARLLLREHAPSNERGEHEAAPWQVVAPRRRAKPATCAAGAAAETGAAAAPPPPAAPSVEAGAEATARPPPGAGRASAEPGKWRRVRCRPKEARATRGGQGLRPRATAPPAPALGQGGARRAPPPVAERAPDTEGASSGEPSGTGGAAQRSVGGAKRSGGGVGPVAALWALLALASTANAEDAVQTLEHADALRAKVAAERAAAITANDEADRELQRACAERRRRTRSCGEPPGGGAPEEVPQPEEVPPQDAPPPGAKEWATRCGGCSRDLSSDEFSNRQRRLLRGGGAARCKVCVRAASPQGQAEGRRAAAAATRAAAEAAEPAVQPDAVEAALARWHWRRAARDAGRAAAAAAAAAEAAVGDTTPVFLDEGGGELRCLANSWPSEFQDDLGRSFASAEHFLMHRKAATFGDEARRALILAEPARAVELGRLVEPFEGARWAEHRDGWVSDALWRKLRAHPEMAATLLGTGGRLLLDGGGGDGALPDAELERRCAEGNRHGRALMRARARLRRAHAIAQHSGALPWQCDPANGGIDWELFADTLECYDAAMCLRDREVVCSRSGERWSDVGFVDVLRRIPLEGGVSASADAVAELDAGGVDRVAGRNGSMGLEEVMASYRLLQAELEAGHLEKFAGRAMMGTASCWFHPISLVTKNKDGAPKFKGAVDYVRGAVRDGQYGADLQPAFRFIDNMSAGRVPATTPDGKRSKSKPARDSLNAFSPLSVPCTLDDVPYIADLIMALKTDGGRLKGAAKRHVHGSTLDISNAYRNVPLRRDHRRLFCFRFLDVTKPIPQYVLDGGQPREEDSIFYRKTVMPFGWIGSVDYWVRLSKALKAVHMWDGCPGVEARVPRKRRPDGSWAPQHAAGIYLDDLGSFGVVDDDGTNWADVSQARYIELCGMLGIPISLEKLAAEGDVGEVVAMLGVLMDCEEEQLRLSPARLEMLAKRCREVQGKAYVTKKELRNLVGVLSFAASCAPAGRTFMRRLYDAQKRKGKFCRVNRGLAVDLAWWIKFVLSDGGWHGASMLVEEFATAAERLGLFTDASLEGFGAAFVLPDGTCEVFSGRWDAVLPGIDTSQETKEWHISEMELLVVIMAMQQWSAHLTQRRVLTRCDNESAVHAINSGRAKDPAMSLLLRELWHVKARGSFEMQSEHIKTHHNRMADDPSRWTRADGTRDAAIEAQFYAFAAEHFGLERGDVREVEVVADTAALLRRMRKAHAGTVHRLHDGGDGEAWPGADPARGA